MDYYPYDLKLDNISVVDIYLKSNISILDIYGVICMRQKQYRQALTPSVFYILFALCEKERHGYEIMKQTEYDSGGKIEMGPGTLYGNIKRMLADGLIEEANKRPVPESDDERRKYYRLTDLGRKQLSMELERYSTAIKLAGKRNLLPDMELIKLS